MTKGNRFNNHFLSLTWLMLFILPNDKVLYYFVPFSFVLLYRLCGGLTQKVSVAVVALTISIALTVLFNIENAYSDFKELFRSMILIILLVSFAKLKGLAILKPYIIIAVFHLIFMQFAFVLNISSVVNIIKTCYPYEGEQNMYGYLESYAFSDFDNRRLGGIYYNPNEYAKYIEMILITLLCEIKQFRKVELLILIPLIVISIAATGSRTSFIVLLFIAVTYLYCNKKIATKNVILGGITGAMIIGYLFANINIEELRMFKINEGIDASIGFKVNLLNTYFDAYLSVSTLLFGNLSTPITAVRYNFGFVSTDFDIGNITIAYGVVFFILFLIFCWEVYRKMSPKYIVIFPIMLWMFSNTIICNYRAVPIFFLMMGLYYRRSLIEKSYE